MSSSQERVGGFIRSTCSRLCVSSASMCRSLDLQLEGGRVLSLHPCCLIGGLLSSLDGLMEAALLRLVGGLIHHSPVRVRCRHLPSSNLILLLHHLLLPTPPTYRQKFSCALPTFSGDNILFSSGRNVGRLNLIQTFATTEQSDHINMTLIS